MADVIPAQTLPDPLAAIFSADADADQIFTALMPALCQVWQCDRCFLYLRDPEGQMARVTHCYSTDPKWPDLAGASWLEEGDVGAKDPLMVLAFRTSEAIYVEDIETAGPDVLNLEYEQQEFGHRALIHAPIYHEGKLYGILEPCTFDAPRPWSAFDRQITALVQAKLGPLVAAYVEAEAKG